MTPISTRFGALRQEDVLNRLGKFIETFHLIASQDGSKDSSRTRKRIEDQNLWLDGPVD